ncbi:MAG: ATP-binding protein [Gemmatimonadota bacterium]
MISIRSFRSRIFLTLLAVSLVPATLVLVTSAMMLREVVVGVGTAGPWAQVGESGQELLRALEAMGPLPAAVEEQALAHRSALTESARLSQVYAFVGERFLKLLPGFTAGMLIFILLLSLMAARRLSRSFSRPVNHLVGWTELLMRGQPLPEKADWEGRGVREFSRLRSAFRSMVEELQVARARELEAQRLRSWTELARKVAHELKNPLTPMRIAAQRVAKATDPSTAEAGTVLLEEVERLDDLARSFAVFGRLPEGPRTPVDVEGMLRTLARTEGVDHPVEVRVESALPALTGHYDTLLRALRNLVVNAREAQASQDEAIVLRARSEDEWVVIEILDRGPGLPPEEERIWDSDFTTKPGGTGLGLQLVLETVRAHGGRVEAGNRSGGGAGFRIRLPGSM